MFVVYPRFSQSVPLEKLCLNLTDFGSPKPFRVKTKIAVLAGNFGASNDIGLSKMHAIHSKKNLHLGYILRRAPDSQADY